MTNIVFAAEAQEKQYTDIVTDLSADKSFDISKYPEKKDDYSIDVIQIAESADNELFVYCYSPCRSVTVGDNSIEVGPTQVSIAVSTDLNSLHYSLQGLKEVHRYKTLTKYVVNGIEVDPMPKTRYYSVPMLQRKTKDGKKIAEKVGKLWTVEKTDSGIKYTETHKETIEIERPLAGIVRYEKDYPWAPANWGKDGVDNHFIAFDTDLPIDDLLEADVEFDTVAIGEGVGQASGKYIPMIQYVGLCSANAAVNGDQYSLARMVQNYAADNNMLQNKSVTIKKDQRYSYDTGGWFSGDTYSWNRIMRPSDFSKVMEDGKMGAYSGEFTAKDLSDRAWVLCYRETPYDSDNGWFEHNYGGFWYDMNIAVLRLKFETNGVVYDLGTVTNKVDQTEYVQGNSPKSLSEFWERVGNWIKDNWYWLLIAVIGVIALIVLVPFLPSILSFIVQLFVWLFKAIIWLISLPIRLIAALFGGGK